MKVLFVLDDPPYGTERCYNALRLAKALQGYYLQDVVARAAREAADAQQVLTQILATRPVSAAPRIGSER
jgi:sulfur relay (sulfurtransferase) complex TusBCD TusD component (DsrE family)